MTTALYSFFPDADELADLPQHGIHPLYTPGKGLELF